MNFFVGLRTEIMCIPHQLSSFIAVRFFCDKYYVFGWMTLNCCRLFEKHVRAILSIITTFLHIIFIITNSFHNIIINTNNDGFWEIFRYLWFKFLRYCIDFFRFISMLYKCVNNSLFFGYMITTASCLCETWTGEKPVGLIYHLTN